MSPNALPDTQLTALSIETDRLRAFAPPLRVVQLSDLHMRAYETEHESLVCTVNAQQPDLILLTGDLVSRDRATLPSLERLVGQLHARLGIYACRGNWEFKHGVRRSVLAALLARAGAELLVNASRLLETEAGTLYVGGVDDLCRGWPDLRATLAPAARADFGILMCHVPMGADLIPAKSGVHLVLSGHTHAGQVRVPLLWRFVLPEYHSGYVAGLYRKAWGHVYVNRGFGGSGPAPVRFCCPPEVTVLTLRGTIQDV